MCVMYNLSGLGEGRWLRCVGKRGLCMLARAWAGGALLLLTGCGTLLNLPLRNGEIYAVTKEDLRGIEDATKPPGRDCGTCLYDFEAYCSNPASILLLGVLTPLDAVAETVLLPYDSVLRRMSEFSMAVVDEQGFPIPEAHIKARYFRNEKELRTDVDGVCRWPLHGTFQLEQYCVSKEGFYATSQWGDAGVQLRQEMKRSKTREVQVVLKAVCDPVPMIGHRVSTTFPGPDGTYGFDLRIGDWVVPHGKGCYSDFLLHVESSRTSNHDREARVELSFTNETDGIQEFTAMDPTGGSSGTDKRSGRWSAFLPPHVAPPEGYVPRWTFAGGYSRSRPVECTFRKDRYYIFRVRSEADSEGKVTTANVGWIRRDFETDVGYKDRPTLGFTYYFNPDRNSRSLEAR